MIEMLTNVSASIVVLMGAPDATDYGVEVLAQPISVYSSMEECQEDSTRLNGLSASWIGFMLANGYWWCESR
jgi:hypothetical protein